jgi:hypothetical protein
MATSKIGINKTTKKRVTKAEKTTAKIRAERYGYETDVDTKNKKGKAYAQKAVKTADAKKDAKRSALKPGKRTTVWNTEYYETRVNRTDKGKKK